MFYASIHSNNGTLDISMDVIPVGYVHENSAQNRRTVGVLCVTSRRLISDLHRRVNTGEGFPVRGWSVVRGSSFETVDASSY